MKASRFALLLILVVLSEVISSTAIQAQWAKLICPPSQAIHFLNSHFGFALEGQYDNKTYITTTGGDTWTVVNDSAFGYRWDTHLQQAYYIEAVSMFYFSPSHALIEPTVGYTDWESVDSGRSWVPTEMPRLSFYKFLGSPDSGEYFCANARGKNSYQQQGLSVYRLSSGSTVATFLLLRDKDISSFGLADINSFDSSEDGTSMAVVGDSIGRRVLLRKQSQKIGWQVLTSLDSGNVGAEANEVKHVSRSSWIGTSPRGTYRSSDDGSSWNLIDSNGADQVSADIVSGVCYAVALDQRRILKSTDRGLTWTPQVLKQYSHRAFSSLELVDSNFVVLAIAANQDGIEQFYQTKNGGERRVGALHVDSLKVNLGLIPYNDTTSRRLVIRNDDSKPWSIIGAHGSSTNYVKLLDSIQLVRAGDSVIIHYRFVSLDGNPDQDTIIILSNDTLQDSIAVVVQARSSRPFAEFLPPANLGTIESGDSVIFPGALRNYGYGPLRVDSVLSSNPVFIIDQRFPIIIPAITDSPMRDTSLHLHIALRVAGLQRTTLTCFTNDPTRTVLTASVSALITQGKVSIAWAEVFADASDTVDEKFAAITSTTSGELVALGTGRLNDSVQCFRLESFDSSGSPNWSRLIGGWPQREAVPGTLKTDSDNNFYFSSLEAVSQYHSHADACLYSFDKNGVYRWGDTITSRLPKYNTFLELAPSGVVLFAGCGFDTGWSTNFSRANYYNEGQMFGLASFS